MVREPQPCLPRLLYLTLRTCADSAPRPAAAADPFQLTALVAAAVVAIFLLVSGTFVGLLDPRIRVAD